jgi:hypothetical protein
MTIYQKLANARAKFRSLPLKQSGRNNHQNYNYFELADFIGDAQECLELQGLLAYVSFGVDIATITVKQFEGDGEIVITSPMSSAALKGCHEVQNLGAVQTYLRRYLWTALMELVETDVLNATHGAPDRTATTPAPAKTYTPAPKPVQQSLPQSTSYPVSVETEDGVINYEDRFQDVQAKFAHKFGAYEAGTMVKDMTAKQLAAFIKDRRWAAENGQEKYRGYAKQDLNAALYFSALVSLPSGTERKENKLVRNMAKESQETAPEATTNEDDEIPF